MSTNYTEEFTLPSKGIIYEDERITEKVVMRAMKAKEEKMLLGSTGESSFDRVIGACIVEPNPFPIGKLILPDKYFLLMKLRIISYGNMYYAEYKCSNSSCREKQEFEIDLDGLDIDYLDEDFEEPFEMELPMCGDVIGMRLLRDKDNKRIQKRARKIKKKARDKAGVGNIEYILRLAERLVTLNGEEIDRNKRKGYIENLLVKDTSYIREYMNNKLKIGYDLRIYDFCQFCGEEVEFTLPLTEEFFRTRFDN